MDILFGSELILVLLVVVAFAAIWYWWTQPPYYAPLPDPFCDRESHETEWRDRYDGEPFQNTDTLLHLLCDAFCFNPAERYKLQPDDRIMDVYRGRYPPTKKWPRADCMEIETLMFTVGQKLGVQSSEWKADLTLADVFSLAAKKRHVERA